MVHFLVMTEKPEYSHFSGGPPALLSWNCNTCQNKVLVLCLIGNDYHPVYHGP